MNSEVRLHTRPSGARYLDRKLDAGQHVQLGSSGSWDSLSQKGQGPAGGGPAADDGAKSLRWKERVPSR